MAISLGNTTIDNVYFGNQRITRIYLGNTLVFSITGRIALENGDLLVTEGGDDIVLE